MFAELLLEIGIEEIPSDYLENGLNELKRLGEIYLRDNRIEIKEDLQTYGTPRRLVLVGKTVADKQEDMIQEITGPPKKAAFDKEGNPTKAAFGFANKQRVSVADLQLLQTPKGDYLHITRTMPGRFTIGILSEMLPKLIANIPWPKSMRWGSEVFSFVRPIHWVLAMFNGTNVPFEVAGITSGTQTWGHRFMAPHSIEIEGLNDYLEKMSECSVIIDQDKREEEVEKSVITAAKTVSGLPVIDPELLSTVANMVEFPSTICGSFDKAFLNLPDIVLITVMKKHQRYFSIRDRTGNLMPHFVAVNNTIVRDESIVKKGHERVLHARLADADFFFNEDRKRLLENRLEDLKTVVYQAELGTSYAKVERFTRLAEYIAEQIIPEKIDDVRLVAQLCKCDLVTEMVMEFPSLQGEMGKEYARLEGYPDDICMAISDHYLPIQAGSRLPDSFIGSIVGIADRVDTIVGFFSIGLAPDGTADPYALRRQALAIIRIMREKNIVISFQDLINESASILNETVSFNAKEVVNTTINFIKYRFKNMLLSAGINQDIIDAVISIDFNFLHQADKKIDALQKFRDNSKDFEMLTMAFKRIINIGKGFEGMYEVNPAIFEHKSEERLWKTFQSVKGEIKQEIDREHYLEALAVLSRLSEPINEFFSEVMVMAEDKLLKENRLAILKYLHQQFLQLADFSKISI
jgi:glycyl-tRNA synthetase beta chain